MNRAGAPTVLPSDASPENRSHRGSGIQLHSRAPNHPASWRGGPFFSDEPALSFQDSAATLHKASRLCFAVIGVEGRSIPSAALLQARASICAPEEAIAQIVRVTFPASR
jgi:hypothetical protein